MTQTLTLTVGQTVQFDVAQVDVNGTVISPANPDYSAPSYTVADDTVVSVASGGAHEEITGLKIGSTTVEATETSSTAGDATPVTGTWDVTVTGPAVAGLSFVQVG